MTADQQMPRKASKKEQVEHVYLFGADGCMTFKIGRSIDVDQRMADIQFMSPLVLKSYWRKPGGSKLEAKLHRTFKAMRTHGEWFDFSGFGTVEAVLTAVTVASFTSTAEQPGVYWIPPDWYPCDKWIFANAEGWELEKLKRDPSEARCVCGHKVAAHNIFPPTLCGGDIPFGIRYSPCDCESYDGPPLLG